MPLGLDEGVSAERPPVGVGLSAVTAAPDTTPAPTGPPPSAPAPVDPNAIAAAQPQEQQPSLLSRVGRVGLGIATLGLSEAGRQIAQEHALVQDALRAKIRQQNLANIASGLNVLALTVQQIGSVQDPAQRAAVTSEFESRIAQEQPEWLPAFQGMVEHAAVAYQARQELLSDAIKRVPEFGFMLLHNSGSTGKASGDQIKDIMAKWSRSRARDFIPQAKTKVGQITKQFEKQFPQRFSELQASDRTLTTDELTEMGTALRDQDPQLNDPGYWANLTNTVQEFPEAVGLKRQSDVEAMRTYEEKAQIKAKYAKPSVQVNINQGKEAAYDQVLAATNDPRLAVAVIGNKGYQDPITNEYTYGTPDDLEKARARRALISNVEELRRVGEEVAQRFGDTSRADEIGNTVRTALRAGDPLLTKYTAVRQQVVDNKRRSITGAQAGGHELDYIQNEVPNLREVAMNGHLSDAASNKLNALQSTALHETVATFHPSKSEQVTKAVSDYVALERSRPGAMGSLPRSEPRPDAPAAPDPRTAALLKEADEVLSRQFKRKATPGEIAAYVNEKLREAAAPPGGGQ